MLDRLKILRNLIHITYVCDKYIIKYKEKKLSKRQKISHRIKHSDKKQ